jgi:hypothetical protein
MTTNPCAGLLRGRMAAMRRWNPLTAHCRTQLAGVTECVRATLPALWPILRDRRLIMVSCLACRLLVLGEGTRRGRFNRQQPDIAKDLLPHAATLWPLARMAHILGGAR